MADLEPFYITTTLPYVNSAPHIGFAMELVRADVVARHHALLGYDVFFNTGTDEHGAKIDEKAREAGVTPQEYVDEAAEKFRNLTSSLSIYPDVNFIRTTDPHHCEAAQAFWRRCQNDIYKGTYNVKYCVGCELEKTDSDLTEEGACPEHPNRTLEEREEENYFFAFSRYQDRLRELYDTAERFVVPDFRLREIRTFVESGIEDFSISRLKHKMPWGVEVPDDPEHVMYVWFDALVNYISAVGWPADEEAYTRYWVHGSPTQYAGKDNLRQQAAMWQAMLMAAGLAPSARIVINGFITNGGQKMSKSLGNVIDPCALIDIYGTDALRYYVIRELNPFEDSGVTEETFKEAYNAHLANGIGNLASRVLKMASAYEVDATNAPVFTASYEDIATKHPEYMNGFTTFNLNAAADVVWEEGARLDGIIADREPFKKIKTDPESARNDVRELVIGLYELAVLLQPFLPNTADTIRTAVTHNKQLEHSLFPRVQ